MSTSLEPRSVAIVLGTRPEVIKLAPLIRRLGDAARVVHTGQHFDHELSPAFFDELGLRPADLQLRVGGARRGAQIGAVVSALDDAFVDAPPRAVVVQGDTNAVLAASLAANAADVPLVHVEAGLRSRDRRMPEEHNRVVADHLADLCLAPTETNVANLRAEGIAGDRVVLTGNTVVEAVTAIAPNANERDRIVGELGLSRDEFVLATIHRPENVDDRVRFTAILDALDTLQVPVVLPLHPRAAARAAEFGLEDRLARLRVIDPVGHRVFLALLESCALAVSDSGGVQEEVTVLKRPAVIVRRSTERPEALETFTRLVEPGSAIVEAGASWLADVGRTRAELAERPSPYGDGSATERSLDAIERLLDRV